MDNGTTCFFRTQVYEKEGIQKYNKCDKPASFIYERNEQSIQCLNEMIQSKVDNKISVL